MTNLHMSQSVVAKRPITGPQTATEMADAVAGTQYGCGPAVGPVRFRPQGVAAGELIVPYIQHRAMRRCAVPDKSCHGAGAGLFRSVQTATASTTPAASCPSAAATCPAAKAAATAGGTPANGAAARCATATREGCTRTDTECPLCRGPFGLRLRNARHMRSRRARDGRCRRMPAAQFPCPFAVLPERLAPGHCRDTAGQCARRAFRPERDSRCATAHLHRPRDHTRTGCGSPGPAQGAKPAPDPGSPPDQPLLPRGLFAAVPGRPLRSGAEMPRRPSIDLARRLPRRHRQSPLREEHNDECNDESRPASRADECRQSDARRRCAGSEPDKGAAGCDPQQLPLRLHAQLLERDAGRTRGVDVPRTTSRQPVGRVPIGSRCDCHSGGTQTDGCAGGACSTRCHKPRTSRATSASGTGCCSRTRRAARSRPCACSTTSSSQTGGPATCCRAAGAGTARRGRGRPPRAHPPPPRPPPPRGRGGGHDVRHRA